jgi:hypothetical protein
MKRQGKAVVFVEVKPDLKRRLKRAAKLEECDLADLARQAFKEKLDALADKHPQLKLAQAQ